VLIATPHHAEQCPLVLQCGLACRVFFGSNRCSLGWYPIQQQGTIPISRSTHPLLTPRHPEAFPSGFRFLIPVGGAAALSVAGPNCMEKSCRMFSHSLRHYYLLCGKPESGHFARSEPWHSGMQVSMLWWVLIIKEGWLGRAAA
jgi:hypothetical protein